MRAYIMSVVDAYVNIAAGSTSPHKSTAVTDRMMANHGGTNESINIGSVSAAITLNTATEIIQRFRVSFVIK